MNKNTVVKRPGLQEVLANVLTQGKFWTRRWHLVSGCSKVSPGCAGCWMEAEARLRQNHPVVSVRCLHEGLLTDDGRWNGTIRLNEHLLDLPLRKQKQEVWAIWTDLFHESVSDQDRDRAFAVMAMEQRHWFIVVTKRPDVAYRYLDGLEGEAPMLTRTKRILKHVPPAKNSATANLAWPLKNIIVLITMEDQDRADIRGPWAKRIASMGWTVGALCEPLLSKVDLGYWTDFCNTHDFPGGFCIDCPDQRPVFSWIITGGESGRNARPVHPDWVRTLRDFAGTMGTPFLFKQWGEWRPPVDDEEYNTAFGREQKIPAFLIDVDGTSNCFYPTDDAGATPESCRCKPMLRAGKKAAGRQLDGIEYLEVPNA